MTAPEENVQPTTSSQPFFTCPQEFNGAVFPNVENEKQLRNIYSFFAQYAYLSLYKLHDGQMSRRG
jgi:hypothetical protein